MSEWIVGVIGAAGYAGILGLMVLENLFPPIPSELIMPLAGFVAARGELNLVLVVISGATGSLIGAVPWYYAAARYGMPRLKRFADRHGRWLTMRPSDVDRVNAWFERYGSGAVFLGRLVPTLRTLVSVPAGFARMRVLPFALLSGAGTLIWTGALAGAGYILGEQYRAIATYIDPVGTAVFLVIAGTYVVRLLTWRRER